MSALHNLIALGKTREALNMLLKAAEGRDPDAYDEAVLLSGSLEKYLKSKKLGLTDSDNELRNIEYGILQLSQQVSFARVQADKTIHWPRKRTIAAIGALLLFGAVIIRYLSAYEKEGVSNYKAPYTKEGTNRPDSQIIQQLPKMQSPAAIKKTEKAMNPMPDSVVRSLPKPREESEGDQVNTIDNSTEQQPPTVNTVEMPEYIAFKLIVNASVHNDSIFIDGKPAVIVRESPIIKIIRLARSNELHKIEIKQGDKSCEKNNLVIKNNQKVTISCAF